MSISYKYRLYCETEEAYQYITGTEEPTECPTSSGHVVQSGSVSIVETIEEYYKSIPFNLTSKDNVGTEVSSISYTPGTDEVGTPTKIKAIVRVNTSFQQAELEEL